MPTACERSEQRARDRYRQAETASRVRCVAPQRSEGERIEPGRVATRQMSSPTNCEVPLVSAHGCCRHSDCTAPPKQKYTDLLSRRGRPVPMLLVIVRCRL